MSVAAEDQVALSGVVRRYAAGVDDRQFDSVAELFTVDAELWLPDPPGVLEPVRRHHGRSAIGDAVAAVASTLRTQHAILGEVYDAGSRPDSAHGRIAGMAHHWVDHDGEIRDVIWYLRYDDDYVWEHATQWRIRRRALTIDAIDTRTIKLVRPAAD